MHASTRRFRCLSLPCLGVVLLVCLLFLSSSARAQVRVGNVDVRVGDAVDESPIPKADISLYVFGEGNFSSHALADAGGRYTFLGIPAGGYTVAAESRNYETAQERIEVFPGETSVVTLSLRRKKDIVAAAPGHNVSSVSLAIPAAAQKEFDAGSSLLATDPQGSLSHFRKAIELYPKYAEAWVLLSLAHLKLNQRADALEDVGKAIEADPKFNKAYTVQGRLLLEGRQFEKAEAALQESLRLEPQAWDAHFELARCYYNLSRMTEALKEAQLARDLPQASTATHLLLADIYLKQSQKKEALAELETYVHAEPASPMLPRIQQKIAQLREQL